MEPKLITCEVMSHEFRNTLGDSVPSEEYPISLHVHPKKLKSTLQEAIDRADGVYDPILLGYGSCGLSTVGLKAEKSHMMIFRTDDCNGIFMGSKQAQRDRAKENPGTYFLSRGYIGSGNASIFDEYDNMEARFGPEKAKRIFGKMMGHYKQILHIIMPGAPDVEGDRAYAKAQAERFGMEYVEMEGSDELITLMALRQSSPDILVVEPGVSVTMEMLLVD